MTKRATPVYCPLCGNRTMPVVTDGVRYCRQCGEPIDDGGNRPL